jgi:putative NADH-flavin reductase
LLGPDVVVLAKDVFGLVSHDLAGFDVVIDASSASRAEPTGTSTSPRR